MKLAAHPQPMLYTPCSVHSGANLDFLMDAIDHSVMKKKIIESAQNKFDDARNAHQIRDFTDT